MRLPVTAPLEDASSGQEGNLSGLPGDFLEYESATLSGCAFLGVLFVDLRVSIEEIQVTQDTQQFPALGHNKTADALFPDDVDGE